MVLVWGIVIVQVNKLDIFSCSPVHFDGCVCSMIPMSYGYDSRLIEQQGGEDCAKSRTICQSVAVLQYTTCQYAQCGSQNTKLTSSLLSTFSTLVNTGCVSRE